MEPRIGVLIVDDSAYMRKLVSSIIEDSPEMYVIGKARNGLDALEKIKKLKPDVVTLDIEMPEMDGLVTLDYLMEECPVPVVMLSNGIDSTLEAFERGAVDFVMKENLLNNSQEDIIIDFHKRVLLAANARIPKRKRVKVSNEVVEPVEPNHLKIKNYMKDLVIIGSSTGGPSALQTILTQFPKSFNIPILVIQHMPPGFTKPLSERFDKLCELHVKEAEHNEILKAGTIYIAPAGLQTTVQKNDQDGYKVRLKITAPIETLYKPSVDVALLSIATTCKEKLLSVILTGMGDDGLRGCHAVKAAGGTVLGESEESCVVYGMPKVVFEAGLVDKQAPIDQMYDEIMKYLSL
ncbi:chemotaxis response regulator protein-glutamate methylesterase [Bacillus sp. 31A1R]|uniref:Protein-glutamate methylesterase/protein-glutamine glutaminase n=1 Tax=Robertmurraya mangrovi TaxID=3098077 RepID=A0ABU5J3V2_9BACI|nr:chemotaxis response regulator protein-glutamate methylesterase [Bacillus sp. 31A1R]MDZ5474110.1 chemotaxis response regulator protein-glutamate methylesterase [Bacillus sp. 31A1R]